MTAAGGTPGQKKRRRAQGSPPQAGDEISTKLDSYTLLEPIGEGTFSVVFKARAKKEGYGHAIVAAKILKDGQSDYSRVHQEYLCLAALKGHENVVEVLDGCSDGCRITLLMPYFEHGDFGESLHNGEFTDVHISSYMRGLFAALVHVHREGFIHRDIKPTNVLYNFESRRTMVVDFGLVQTREEASQTQSAAPPRDSHAGSPRNRASRPPAAAGAEASRASGATTTTTTTAAAADSGASGSTAPGRRAARSAPNAPLPGFRVPSGHLFGGVGHLQTLLARREGTRGFRAPEVLMQSEQQSPAIDVWSAGVILLCLLTKRYPIFDATDDQYALQEICVLLGPQECGHAARFNYELKTWESKNAPAAQDLAHLLSGQEVDAPWVELVCSCLRLDPKQRSSAKKAGDSTVLELVT
jgi:cell division control protein 7